MNHKVVSQGDWLVARKELLVKEKEFSRLRDETESAAQGSPLGKS